MILHHMRAWLRQQLIGRACIARRIRWIVCISDAQLACYHQRQQAIDAPSSGAVRERIRGVAVEQQVGARLAGSLEELRREAALDFP